MQVRIVPSGTGTPAGKLAGLKIVGLSVWEGRHGSPNVTLPSLVVHGER